MSAAIALPTDPRELAGVALVVADTGRMTVTFSNGTTAIVVRSPLSFYSEHELFDVWLPSSRLGFESDLMPNKKPSEVLGILATIAEDSFRADMGVS